MDESILKPGLDWTRLFMSLTAGAGRRAVNIKTHEKDELNINNYYLRFVPLSLTVSSRSKLISTKDTVGERGAKGKGKENV